MVLKRLRHIWGQKLASSVDSSPFRRAFLEKLEPRILLSGDGLLSAAMPDPLQDTPQVVQYAELLETDEQLPTAGQEIHQESDACDTPEADIPQPIFTF